MIGSYRLLDVIGEGGMGIVYRAEHVETRDRVAIKTVRLTHERELESLRREIYALQRIDHPGVVRILDEGVTAGAPWYSMELLNGETLSDFNRGAWLAVGGATPSSSSNNDEIETQIDLPARDRPRATQDDNAGPRRAAAAGQLETALALVRGLCASLAFLHGEGIVHRDLKSANVFLRADRSPVLIDFGLVWRFPGALAREVLDVSMPVAGTAGYMAPEQILGDNVDARADLYAVGCVLYELVTGHLPYRNEPLIRKLSGPPTAPSRVVDGVPPALDALILRLLEKRPRDRLGHAADIVLAIDTILGSPRPNGQRPSSTPRSYVYRPELTGRDAPFKALRAHFDNLERGDGGCVVLRGESGIGQTYLAMTAVRHAITRGLQVVAGASTPLGASSGTGRRNESPLHPFGRFFEAVADRCMVEGKAKTEHLLGARGKLLDAYEPRFADLPGQDEHPHPPELPAKAARQRLFAALAETLGAYASTWPLVLVLDDLQWADELSQQFLTSLEPEFFAVHPILVLATYRAEETSDALRGLSARAHVTHIDLGPLDEATVAAIATDMLGLDDPSPTFFRSLAVKAEGNPFFVGEYVRAAVDEGLVRRDASGRWRVVEKAAEVPLPGTLRELVRRRVEGLSPDARALLEVASIVGRDVDAGFLAQIGGVDAESQRGAIQALLARQILEEPEPGRLRFLHDKLREHTYEQVERGRRRSVHLVTARSLEAQGKSTGGLPRLYARLAHHYLETDESAKAIDYLEKAATQALASFANREAIRLFGQANTLDDTNGKAAIAGGDVRLRRARRERQLADAHYGLGELEPVLEHGRRALAWMGEPSPTSNRGWLGHLSYNIGLQLLHRLRPQAFVVAGERERELAREASVATQRLAVRYYYNFDALPLIASSFRSVNLAERASTGVSAATAYGILSMTLGISKLHGLGRRYGELARAIAKETDDRVGLVFSLYARAAWRIGDGAWDEVRALSNEAFDVSRRDGAVPDPSDVAIIETLLAHTEFYTGRFEESRRMFDRIEATARARGNAQYTAWGLYASARALIPLGRIDDARVKLEEAHALLEDQIDVPSRIMCPGLLASVYLALGDRARAVTFADITAARIRKNLPTVFATVAGYVGVADVYLAEWHRSIREKGDVRAARGRVRSAMFALWSFALNIPIGRPYYHRVRGLELVALGRTRSARRAFARAIDWATRLGMPYEEALARLELGASSPRPAAHGIGRSSSPEPRSCSRRWSAPSISRERAP